VNSNRTSLRIDRTRATRTAGIACVLSAGVMMMATTFVSPGANASEATNVVTRTWAQDGLGKRDALAELDMLIQDEALLNDGTTWSDADPASAVTPPIDEVPLKPTYVKRYNVTQAGIPTFVEGETARFRIRVYPRFIGVRPDGTAYLSYSDVTAKATTDNAATPAMGCDVTNPTRIEPEASMEFECTVPNVQARGIGTAEDLIHTISVTRVATDDPAKTPLTLTESAAINVVKPCLAVKKETRAAGSNGEWLDAQTLDAALRVASGASAEYRITVSNCGETELVNIVVNDTIPGCSKSIDGSLAVGASTSYTTATAGSEACLSTNVSEPVTSTATANAQSLVNGRPVGSLTASDPVNVNAKGTVVPTTITPTTTATTVEPTTVAPTTVDPTTVAPTTVEPTTVAPTTAEPTTVAPTTVEPTTVAPTTAEPTTVAPTTAEPTTVAPTTVEPTTVAPTTVEPTTVAPTTTATTIAPTTVATTISPTTVATTVATTIATTVPQPSPSGCIGIKKYVRQAGTNGEWLDAQEPSSAALIAFGATAEYRIVVNNCGNVPLVDVVVTDSIAGCAKNIGVLTVGGGFEYTTLSGGSGDCKTAPVSASLCSTATVTAVPAFAGAARLTLSDPACIATVVPASVAPTTVAPTTAAPTTAATTVAPPTTATVQVLNNTIATVSEPTEDLSVTGSTTRPMVQASAALLLIGLALLQLSRRKTSALKA
jgi:hypothetical protein